VQRADRAAPQLRPLALCAGATGHILAPGAGQDFLRHIRTADYFQHNPVSVNTYPQGRHSSSKLYPLGIGICHAFSPPWGGEAWPAVESPGEVLRGYKHVPRGHVRHAPRGTAAGANTSPGDVFTRPLGTCRPSPAWPPPRSACAKGYKYYELCTCWTRRPSHCSDQWSYWSTVRAITAVHCVPSHASLPTAHPET